MAARIKHIAHKAGVPGILQTLQEMSELVRHNQTLPSVRRKVREFTDGGASHLTILRRIHAWMRKQFVYVDDPTSGELVRGLAYMERNGFYAGDCDCLSNVAATYIAAADIKLYWKVVAHEKRHPLEPCTRQNADYSHVYIVAADAPDNRQFIPLDPVFPLFGGEIPHCRAFYQLV